MPKYIGYDTRIDWPTPELSALISLLSPGKALDIGCGHGTESILLGSYGWKVLGFDRENDDGQNPIKEAQKRLQKFPPKVRKNVTFLASDLSNFEVKEPGEFNLVLDRLVYHNFIGRKGQQWRALRQKLLSVAATALRPGGLFLMRFSYRTGPWEFLKKGPLYPISKGDREFIKTYFEIGRHVGFSTLSSPMESKSKKTYITPRSMTLLILKKSRRVHVEASSEIAAQKDILSEEVNVPMCNSQSQ